MTTVEMNFLLANQGQIYLFLLTALGYLIDKQKNSAPPNRPD